jgi:hypothetical protein
VSIPVKATIPTGIAIRKSTSVGLTPKSMFEIRISGERTRTAPRPTRATWVKRSAIARTMLTLAASFVPTTLSHPSTTITPMPTMMSQGA